MLVWGMAKAESHQQVKATFGVGSGGCSKSVNGITGVIVWYVGVMHLLFYFPLALTYYSGFHFLFHYIYD